MISLSWIFFLMSWNFSSDPRELETMQKLNNGDMDRPLRITCYDWDRDTLAQMLDDVYEIL